MPEEALSAATLVALAAKKLVMFSDACLSPIEPQVFYKNRYVSALDLLKKKRRSDLRRCSKRN